MLAALLRVGNSRPRWARAFVDRIEPAERYQNGSTGPAIEDRVVIIGVP